MSNHQKNQGLLEKMDEIKNILFSVDKNIYDRLDIINKNIDNLFLLLQKKILVLQLLSKPVQIIELG